MMKKWMSLLAALMMLMTVMLPASAEESPAWTEEQLAAMDAALSDEGHLELLDTFRYHVESDDLSVTEDLDDDIMNILLLGTDSAGKLNYGRTDAMIVCSINMRTGETKLSSIVRDLYVDIPYMKLKNRINTANAFGGPNMAMKTVNEQLGLNIEYYCSINFTGFRELVNVLGGVELTISGAEAQLITNDQSCTPISGGTRVLDGAQALSYCRIRSLDDNFGRNERQRKFLDAMLQKVVAENPMDQLIKLVETAMKYMDTNLTPNHIMSVLFTVVPNLTELQMYSCPEVGQYKLITVRDGASVVEGNMEAIRESVHAFIYGENEK